VLFGLWVFLPFGVWMTYCACENLEGKVFAKVPRLEFLAELLCLGCHGKLIVWLLGKLRESERNEILGLMVSFLGLLKRIEINNNNNNNKIKQKTKEA
jgi:hypothetical protein